MATIQKCINSENAEAKEDILKISKAQDSIGESALEIALNGDKSKIGDIVQNEVKAKLYSYVPEAREIWTATLDNFSKIEHRTEALFQLNEKLKLYALDGIIIADSLGIPKKDRFAALQAFTLYYLAVHLLDDLIEDPAKFISKFSFKTKKEFDSHIKAVGASFIFHVGIAVSQILVADGGYNSKETNEISQKFMESLAKQIKYFVLEKESAMAPERVLEIKQHCVSGESTSFIAVCLRLDVRYGKFYYEHIKKALNYLGSLTQFTDDLRDYRKDIENNNANLLVSMEKYYGANAKSIFMNWYLLEEGMMLDEIKKTKLKSDENLISVIPWYPFFIKHLAIYFCLR